jgi:hypothetical protein
MASLMKTAQGGVFRPCWPLSARLSAALQLITLLMVRGTLMANIRVKPSLRLLRCYPLAVCVGPGAVLEPFRYTPGGFALDATLVVVLPAGAYTRPFFGSTYAHFVEYVGCMNLPQSIRHGDTGRCDQNGLG